MKKHLFLAWMASTILLIVIFFAPQSFGVTPLLSQKLSEQVDKPIALSSYDVCAIVISMPNAQNTNELLSLLKTSPHKVIKNLEAMKANMEQYDAEGYGWQNVIDGSSSLEPRPGSWLIGVLRMACEH